MTLIVITTKQYKETAVRLPQYYLKLKAQTKKFEIHIGFDLF